ncbi:MAG: MaoC/PaaZ C-terminal domain-containing protein [Smithellaceae bacterium]
MALNLSSIGFPIGPLIRDYNWKDIILYALSIGAGFNELNYTYEKDLKVIPTFSIAMITDFLWAMQKSANINLKGILHGEQELIFHNTIPLSGTLTTMGTITNIFDKGEKGAVIRAESITAHSSGKKLYTNVVKAYGRLDGGFGGKPGITKSVKYPDKEADFVIDNLPSADQPLLYRLSGDLFELHVDPEFARRSGFQKPIMHGLCTMGFACRALLKSLIPGEPDRTKRIACRFSAPLYPGEPIKTLIWNVGNGSAVWRVVHGSTGQMLINYGEFEYVV